MNKIESYVRNLAIDFDNKDIRIKKQMLQTFVDKIIISKDIIAIKLKFLGLADSDNDGALEEKLFLSLTKIYPRNVSKCTKGTYFSSLLRMIKSPVAS